MILFARRPFLFIAPLVCFGILLAENYRMPIVPCVMLVGCLILYLFVPIKGMREVLLVIACVALGACAAQFSRGEQEDIKDEKILAIVHVDEITASKSDWRKAVVSVRELVKEGEVDKSTEQMLVLFNAPAVEQGDVLAVLIDAQVIRNRDNPGEFDMQGYWNHQNVFRMAFVSELDVRFLAHEELPRLNQFWQTIRESCAVVLQRNLSPELASIAQALILGDKSLLSGEDRASFSNAGAMHVLAVSGLHVGIVVYLLLFFFELFPRFFTRAQASVLALILVWMYAGVTGLSPSVQRAAFMFTLLVLGQVLGRKGDSLNLLFLSAFILLLIDPLLMYDIGFQLSYLAMIGILTLNREISTLLYVKNKVLRKAWEGTAVGIAAQVYTAPLSLYYFHQFPNYFALSNLVVMAVSALILGIGLVLFAVKELAWLVKPLAFLLGLCLLSLLYTMQVVEDLPAAVALGFDVSFYWLVAAYFLLLFWFVFRQNKTLRTLIVSSALLLLIVLQAGRFLNWKHSEVLVFNDRQLVIGLKEGNQIWCFHPANEKAEKIAGRLIADYQKIHPGQVKFLPLELGETVLSVGGDRAVCKLRDGAMEFSYKNVDFTVRMSFKAETSKGRTEIDMPYFSREEGRTNLMDGAIRYKLE